MAHHVFIAARLGLFISLVGFLGSVVISLLFPSPLPGPLAPDILMIIALVFCSAALVGGAWFQKDDKDIPVTTLRSLAALALLVQIGAHATQEFAAPATSLVLWSLLFGSWLRWHRWEFDSDAWTNSGPVLKADFTWCLLIALAGMVHKSWMFVYDIF